jgi:hypothetical protein
MERTRERKVGRLEELLPVRRHSGVPTTHGKKEESRVGPCFRNMQYISRTSSARRTSATSRPTNEFMDLYTVG